MVVFASISLDNVATLLPFLPNASYNEKVGDDRYKNPLPENNPTDANDRTRDLTGSGNLPNSPNGQPESSDVANNGEVPLPQALPQPQSSFWDGFAAGFTNGAVNVVSDFVNAVTHPADTVRNIGGAAATVATNPSVVSEAVVDAYDQKRAAIENAQNSFERGVESGSTTAAMATFFIPGGQAGKVQTAGAVLGKAAKTTDSVSDVAKAAKKAEQLTKNKAQGNKFENQTFNDAQGYLQETTQQITVVTDSGTKTRLDIVGRDKQGNAVCIECKSSPTAPLTPNQKTAFPEIEKSGATVVGKGKTGFEGGTRIEPTTVKVVRPKND